MFQGIFLHKSINSLTKSLMLFLFQDLKNQILTTNLWVETVKDYSDSHSLPVKIVVLWKEFNLNSIHIATIAVYECIQNLHLFGIYFQHMAFLNRWVWIRWGLISFIIWLNKVGNVFKSLKDSKKNKLFEARIRSYY